jgi:uncharacterized cofD-like protein
LAYPEANRNGKSLAVVGGGSGLAVVLRGLKHWVGSGGLSSLTGVVTMADDGGSSGRLRRDFGVLPPGDIRSCLVALADDEDLLARLFQYRFPGGDGLSEHSFGNLFLTALTGITGDFYQAILTAEAILSVRGQILPSTLADVRLHARGRSGRLYHGESAVGSAGEPLAEVSLEPAAPVAFPQAVQALEEADLILLGPGSLYTSILPNLLIPGILQALRRSRGRVVLALNLMTQPGETDGMSALDHIEALEAHAGPGLIQALIFHQSELPRDRLRPYREVGAEPVVVESAALAARGLELVPADLVATGDFVHHDPQKLAQTVMTMIGGRASSQAPAQVPSQGLDGSSARTLHKGPWKRETR